MNLFLAHTPEMKVQHHFPHKKSSYFRLVLKGIWKYFHCLYHYKLRQSFFRNSIYKAHKEFHKSKTATLTSNHSQSEISQTQERYNQSLLQFVTAESTCEKTNVCVRIKCRNDALSSATTKRKRKYVYPKRHEVCTAHRVAPKES